MTEIYLNAAKNFMTRKQWSYAETALRRALSSANKERLPTGDIFRAMNYVRRVV